MSIAAIRNAALLALILAFMGGTALSGCSSGEEDDCACSPDAFNYPDCCSTTL